MIRVTVKEIYELQKSIQSTGEVHALIGPQEAFSTGKFFVAWARSVHGEDFYLALYRDAESWRKASEVRVSTHANVVTSPPVEVKPIPAGDADEDDPVYAEDDDEYDEEEEEEYDEDPDFNDEVDDPSDPPELYSNRSVEGRYRENE